MNKPLKNHRSRRSSTSLSLILLLTMIVIVLIATLAGSRPQKVDAAAPQGTTSKDGIWSTTDSSSLRPSDAGARLPLAYATVRLNKNRIDELLRTVPREFTEQPANEKVELSLPMPDGSFGRFVLTETSMMEPELAARYSNYKTYSGQGIDDPTATAKIDWTPYGFHAMVLREGGDVFVDPYSQTDTTNYISYKRSDSVSDGPFHCLVNGAQSNSSVSNLARPTPRFVSGANLRTLRTAIAATAEYTAANGGTVNSALAAITTAVNRLNGIFERDVTIRFILVNNQANIIYTNAATDPYTNGNPGTMLTENQTNLNNVAVIGPANYDIGHVFGTLPPGGGGSGIAQTPAVCQDGGKASGASCATTTSGDSFVVGIVAHELAHQLSAEHSFNGSVDNCDQRQASAGYEPGSGSTIMSYSSACGAQNLQLDADAYFHSNSINQMLTHIGTQACQATVATGNTPPTINSGGNFNIPKNTPFALTASGNDVNGDAVTFNWEELDLGPQSPPDTDADGQARPIFRSFTATASPTRTFPRLADILTNNNLPPTTYNCGGPQCLTGEILPSISRVMTFQVTARDNRAGGGGVNSATMQLTVDGNSGPFVVTAPNTAVNWTGFTQQNVTWSVANTTNAPVSAANVKISLSTDGGNTFPTVLLASTPNNGTASVTVPNTATNTARIKVEGVGNVFFDVSNTNFTITGGVAPVTTIQLASAAQNVAEAVGSTTVIVNRTGDTTGASTVQYATSDTAGAALCSVINGQASSRCDYLITLGTLNFAAGETSKNILIPIIDDVYAEGPEIFTITLSNATGATLGVPATGTLTITDNEAVNGQNPIDTAGFFVRQHYVDFLNREPDGPGLAFWTNEITSCGANAPCIEVKRINVSAAFFLSIEFQETGYLVYRVYKSAFGNLAAPAGAPVPVNFSDFLRDTQRIGQGVQVGIGDWQNQLEANKVAYALAFVQRADFLAAYPNTMTGPEFVDQLNTRAGAVLSPAERTTLINVLGGTPANVNSRAQVLRSVADDSDLRAAEFNKAFVLMQYFGYLRRNPFDLPDNNFDGYNFWLTKLLNFNGNFVNAEMVKAFILSGEYRQRFGP